MTTRDTLIEGTELQRIREAANLSREELAVRLGNGGYQDQNVKAIEKGTRIAGLNVLRSWAKACGYTFQIRFDRDPAIPQQSLPDSKPVGWFASNRANRYHYDPGTGKSLCGKAFADETTDYNTVLNSPLNCRKCQYHYHNQ